MLMRHVLYLGKIKRRSLRSGVMILHAQLLVLVMTPQINNGTFVINACLRYSTRLTRLIRVFAFLNFTPLALNDGG
jgi:hypothetical protein